MGIQASERDLNNFSDIFSNKKWRGRGTVNGLPRNICIKMFQGGDLI